MTCSERRGWLFHPYVIIFSYFPFSGTDVGSSLPADGTSSDQHWRLMPVLAATVVEPDNYSKLLLGGKEDFGIADSPLKLTALFLTFGINNTVTIITNDNVVPVLHPVTSLKHGGNTCRLGGYLRPYVNSHHNKEFIMFILSFSVNVLWNFFLLLIPQLSLGWTRTR